MVKMDTKWVWDREETNIWSGPRLVFRTITVGDEQIFTQEHKQEEKQLQSKNKETKINHEMDYIDTDSDTN